MPAYLATVLSPQTPMNYDPITEIEGHDEEDHVFDYRTPDWAVRSRIFSKKRFLYPQILFSADAEDARGKACHLGDGIFGKCTVRPQDCVIHDITRSVTGYVRRPLDQYEHHDFYLLTGWTVYSSEGNHFPDFIYGASMGSTWKEAFDKYLELRMESIGIEHFACSGYCVKLHRIKRSVLARFCATETVSQPSVRFLGSPSSLYH